MLETQNNTAGPISKHCKTKDNHSPSSLRLCAAFVISRTPPCSWPCNRLLNRWIRMMRRKRSQVTWSYVTFLIDAVYKRSFDKCIVARRYHRPSKGRWQMFEQRTFQVVIQAEQMHAFSPATFTKLHIQRVLKRFLWIEMYSPGQLPSLGVWN